MVSGVKTRDDAQELEEIRQLLASGLKTEVFPRADTAAETQEIVARLRVAGGDLVAKLVIGGFTDHTIEHGGIEQPCETCMYYLVHRKYCELPELDCPVEPQWSCRLWRI
ncbi:MAG: hypothetical protein ACT4OU_03140 [Hyphomicrobium sp.]